MLKDIIGQRKDSPDNQAQLSRSKRAAADVVDGGEANGTAPEVSGESVTAGLSLRRHEMMAAGDGIASEGEPPAGLPPSALHGHLKVEGTLQCPGDLVIDAAFDGEVVADGVLTIGRNGSVTGQVRARSVIICGRIQGNVHAAERCELRTHGAVDGDISAASLAIEDGAAFFGRSAVGAGRQQAGRDRGASAPA